MCLSFFWSIECKRWNSKKNVSKRKKKDFYKITLHTNTSTQKKKLHCKTNEIDRFTLFSFFFIVFFFVIVHLCCHVSSVIFCRLLTILDCVGCESNVTQIVAKAYKYKVYVHCKYRTKTVCLFDCGECQKTSDDFVISDGKYDSCSSVWRCCTYVCDVTTILREHSLSANILITTNPYTRNV